ncbi:hypothetical protein MSTO_41800 [Mycobacterium stomatepiae]|uniref:Monooxygenase n=1 Tax=Mycobacterium stomatepiae TaxID=470076 RepID=A0A7I7QCE2_9MYCO|nr:hypothetical protein MSTO_41800 [Mycobacterium stomatepiae]
MVTSVNDSEAQNFGVDTHLGHDERYDRADEFMDVVTGLWDTWEDDAILHDRGSGHYADPAKVHELGHVGQYFCARGPLTVPAPRKAGRSSSRPVLRGGVVNSPRAGRN